jgi:Plasmid replication region DNA-binding N-term
MPATVQDVHDAADQLNGEGLKPTYDAIRARLGKCSFTLIRDGLKSWVPKASEAASLDPAPDEVVQTALLFGSRVWETALAFASKQTDEKLVLLQADLDHVFGDLQSVITTADQAAADNDQMKVENEALKVTLGKFRNTLAVRDKELIAVKAEAETLRRALDQFAQTLLSNVQPAAGSGT